MNKINLKISVMSYKIRGKSARKEIEKRIKSRKVLQVRAFQTWILNVILVVNSGEESTKVPYQNNKLIRFKNGYYLSLTLGSFWYAGLTNYRTKNKNFGLIYPISFLKSLSLSGYSSGMTLLATFLHN